MFNPKVSSVGWGELVQQDLETRILFSIAISRGVKGFPRVPERQLGLLVNSRYFPRRVLLISPFARPALPPSRSPGPLRRLGKGSAVPGQDVRLASEGR